MFVCFRCFAVWPLRFPDRFPIFFVCSKSYRFIAVCTFQYVLPLICELLVSLEIRCKPKVLRKYQFEQNFSWSHSTPRRLYHMKMVKITKIWSTMLHFLMCVCLGVDGATCSARCGSSNSWYLRCWFFLCAVVSCWGSRLSSYRAFVATHVDLQHLDHTLVPGVQKERMNGKSLFQTLLCECLVVKPSSCIYLWGFILICLPKNQRWKLQKQTRLLTKWIG